MRWVALLMALVGCDAVFGAEFRPDAAVVGDAGDDNDEDGGVDGPTSEDLDDDGELDSIDPCITPLAEAVADDDSDGDQNGEDACPIDRVHLGNSDGDALDKPCDPDDGATGTRTCFMSFTSPQLNEALWAQLAPEPTWGAAAGALSHSRSTTQKFDAYLATRDVRVDGTATVELDLDLMDTTGDGGFILWLEAAEQDPGEADGFGCFLTMIDSKLVLRVLGVAGTAPVTVAQGGATSFAVRLRGTYTVGTTMPVVRCEARLVSSDAWITTAAAVMAAEPRGRLGFAAKAWPLAIQALTVFQHE